MQNKYVRHNLSLIDNRFESEKAMFTPDVISITIINSKVDLIAKISTLDKSTAPETRTQGC